MADLAAEQATEQAAGQPRDRAGDMRLLMKAVLSLLVLGAIGIVAYAVFSDLPAPSEPVELPVTSK
ncbi:hypothetical protein ACLJK8_08640 [Amaricoccus sp. W119]